MSYSNFHTHSTYCDGKADLESFVLEAISYKMQTLGFSSHAPFLYDTNWSMPMDKLDDYLIEVSQLRLKYWNELKIYKSLEIDYISGKLGPSTYASKLDYTIGSVHFIGQYPNGNYWGIDISKEDFEKGLADLFNNDIKKLVEVYYATIREMLEKDKPDVLGHWDIVKKFNRGDVYFSENEEWYKLEVRKTMHAIAQSGVIVEVNLRGMITNKTEEPFPSYWILAEMQKLKIPITISADAHLPYELTKCQDDIRQKLKSIGYEKICIFEENKWIESNL